MTAEPLTPAQIAGRMSAALATITSLWDDMLEPTGTATGGGHGDPRVIQVCNVRQEVNWQVRGWCQVLIEDHQLDDRTPDGHDTLGLCAYLRKHVDLMAAHEANLDALQELEDCADAVTNVVFGHKRPRLALGACTITACDGIVRDAGQDDDGHQIARCAECGTTANVRWWAEQMRMPVRDTLTGAELIVLAHQQYGRRLTPSAIKMAVKRQMLTPLPNTRPQAFTMAQCVGYLTRATT